jgi:predicted aspartyl protease
MDEIRVKVLLTNATDVALHRMKKLPKKKIRTYEADALVDTWAVRSVIPPFIFEQLGLGLTGTRVAEYADGRTEVVGVSEGIVFKYLGRQSLEEALVLGDEVLLGQTFLESTDLMADCTNKRLMPNPAHPDQPILKVK